MPDDPLICAGPDLHLWWMPLEGAGDANSAERVAAQRYRTAAERDRFLAGRVALRRVLAVHLDSSPEAVPIAYGRHGRPVVVGSGGVHCSLARTDTHVLIAVSAGRPVGVDVEGRHAGIDGVAERVLTRHEARTVECDADPRGAALRYFVAKEALLKAMGTGLWVEPREIEIVWNAKGTAAVDDGAWTISIVRPDADHVGAVAVARA